MVVHFSRTVSLLHMRIYAILLFVWFTLPESANCCNKAVIYNKEFHDGLFEEPVVRGTVEDLAMNEISGVAASRRHKDILYVMNDSRHKPRIFAINATNAKLVAILNINNALNCDWEDIAVGPGPYGQYYIYIGDIGGNTRSRCDTIYRIREPMKIEDASLDIHGIMRYYWDEPNCETMMVDETGTLYLLAKIRPGEHKPKLYTVPNFRLRFRKQNLSNGSAVEINLEAQGPTGGDISVSGREILIRTYNYVYYWRRDLTSSIAATLTREPIQLPSIRVEPQGEAVCWDQSGSGFFTTSEGPNRPLYYYARGPIGKMLNNES